jgi:hypothetical protein
MNKDIAELLKEKAVEIAKYYSDKNREKNYSNETFSISKIIPLSEFSAAVEFIKTPSHKKAVAALFWINAGEGYWIYFFPTDSHLLGMKYFEDIKQKVEENNFSLN